MKAKYVNRKDGEGFEIPSGILCRLACCDCGLVHDIVIVSNDRKPVGFAAKRNNRATAQKRRGEYDLDYIGQGTGDMEGPTRQELKAALEVSN